MCFVRPGLVVLGISYSLCIAFLVFAQPSWQSQLPQPPEVKAELVPDSLISDTARSATFRLAVFVPADHHGYLDTGDEGLLIPFAFTFAALEERGLRVAMQTSPPGERDESVHATVLRGRGEFGFRVDAEEQASLPNGETFSAQLRYQICNDVTNICYPPRQTEVPLHFASFPATTVTSDRTSQTPPSPVPALTIGERITVLFERYTQHFFLALGVVFLAGLIAVATPCVYPILPITSAILVARGGGSRQRSRWHAIVYFLGVIFFYTLLGLFAAVTGSALTKIMTNGWINLGFAGLFAYFGLSMLGLYEFQFLPLLVAKLDTTSSHARGFSGTFLMGSTAGLVASPCIGPVAGAILLQIAGQTAGASASDHAMGFDAILRGIVLMTCFGVGLGLPFLATGLVSHWLPRSGQWLSRVKFALGLPIVYFAYLYYLKGMETIGVSGHIAHAMLVGIVAIGLAAFIGAFHPIGEKPPHGLLLRRALGIILLIIGVHFLYNGLGQSGILISAPSGSSNGMRESPSTSLQPTVTNGQPSSQIEVHGNLQWLRDFSLAQQRARSERKPMFVDFYATWCANCKAFQKLTISHRDLNEALQQAVLVKIYDTDTNFRRFQENPHYPELYGVGGQPFLPLFAIYSPQGELTWKGQNYRAVNTMIAQLDLATRAPQVSN